MTLNTLNNKHIFNTVLQKMKYETLIHNSIFYWKISMNVCFTTSVQNNRWVTDERHFEYKSPLVHAVHS